MVTGTFTCGQQIQKYGYRKTAACMLCQKAREECGGSWNGELPKETIGHIQSAGCFGQKEVVTDSGIKKSVISFARRKGCGKQREMKK